MSKAKKKDAKPISLKKETYKQLNSQLAYSLSWLKELLGEKKFESRVNKAAKLLSGGIKQKTPKKIKPEKKKGSKRKTETAKPVIEK